MKKLVAESGAKTKRAIAGIGMSHVFTSIITVPLVADKDLPHYVETQAQKLVSSPISELQLDWKVLDREDAEKTKRKSLRVLVSGTKRIEVQKFVEVFRLAGLELVSLEPESFALLRALVGRDLATTMLIDLGASRTNVSIAERGIPVFNRSINVGGSSLTERIATLLEIPPGEAEQVKRDIRSLGERGESGLPKSVETTMTPLLHDLEYLFKQYNQDQESIGASRIEKIIFTGGSCVLPNLVEHVSQMLDVNAYIGDPFARLSYAEGLAPILDEIGHRFAVAVGLALHEG